MADTSKDGLLFVVVCGMQLLRLRSAIRQHHPPQRSVLSQICCFGKRKVVLFQILLDGAEPRGAGLSSPVQTSDIKVNSKKVKPMNVRSRLLS